MTSLSPPHMVVVKKEEKEARLRAFLTEALELTIEGGQPVLRLLARSSTSPVVKAVAGLQSELSAAGVEARVMFASLDGPEVSATGRECHIRHLDDVRCHDAHEMLVLTPAHSWVGDCMRRDPGKRDSFELHAGNCPQSAKWATIAFDKLWAAGKPVAERTLTMQASAMEMAADLASLAAEQPTEPVVLTRH